MITSKGLDNSKAFTILTKALTLRVFIMVKGH